MDGGEQVRPGVDLGGFGGRGRSGLTQFKRIFSNNKRKIMYELTGKIKFEGEDLCIKIEELTCSGDQ